MSRRWSHPELAADLLTFLRQPTQSTASQWCAINEVWCGERRFDVVAVSVWKSKPDLRAYEVKVTESDLAAELRSGKWRAMREAGAAAYIAVPEYLPVDKDKLPPLVGLVRRKESGWVHEVRPPRRAPAKAGDLLISMLAAHRREYEERRAKAPFHAPAPAAPPVDDLTALLRSLEERERLVADREARVAGREAYFAAHDRTLLQRLGAGK